MLKEEIRKRLLEEIDFSKTHTDAILKKNTVYGLLQEVYNEEKEKAIKEKYQNALYSDFDLIIKGFKTDDFISEKVSIFNFFKNLTSFIDEKNTFFSKETTAVKELDSWKKSTFYYGNEPWNDIRLNQRDFLSHIMNSKKISTPLMKNYRQIMKYIQFSHLDSTKMIVNRDGVDYIFSFYKNKNYTVNYQLIGCILRKDDKKLYCIKTTRNEGFVVFYKSGEDLLYLEKEPVWKDREEFCFIKSKNILNISTKDSYIEDAEYKLNRSMINHTNSYKLIKEKNKKEVLFYENNELVGKLFKLKKQTTYEKELNVFFKEKTISDNFAMKITEDLVSYYHSFDLNHYNEIKEVVSAPTTSEQLLSECYIYSYPDDNWDMTHELLELNFSY